MIEAVVSALITLCVLAIVVYIILWVLEIIGISPPAKVVQLLWVIVALFGLLLVVKTVLPHAGYRLGSLLQYFA